MNEPATTRMNLLQAVNSGLDNAMAADKKVICLGEDIGKFGGVFRATSNLQEKYGKPRCFNTPLT
ncbi:MAG: alpha-ketoacid dehydrogenase subunit beta, partial [Porticoccaceae bacterium]